MIIGGEIMKLGDKVRDEEWDINGIIVDIRKEEEYPIIIQPNGLYYLIKYKENELNVLKPIWLYIIKL